MRQLWMVGVALVMVFPAMPVWSTGGGAAQAEDCPVTENGDEEDPCPREICTIFYCYPIGSSGPGGFLQDGPGAFMPTYGDYALKRLFNRNDINAAVR